MPTKKRIADITAEQVLRRLAELEEHAAAFYEGLLDVAETKPLRKLGETMLKAEKRHRKRFLAYAEHAKKHDDPSEYALSGEWPGEVDRLMTVQPFPAPDKARQSARRSEPVEFFKFAIRAEEHMALLLAELRLHVPKKHKPYLTRVMNEEWAHKAKLEEYTRKYFA
mgnify:CR=1 FL=1